MSIAKSALAVLAGYLIFALPVFAFFPLVGQPPHQAAPLPIMVASIAVGFISALLGGYIAARLSPRRPLLHGVVLAALIALGATVSLVSTLGHGAIWSQIAALVLMAPSAVAGSWLRAKRSPGS